LPALLALAQRAFMRSEILLLPASLIWPRLRGPAEEVEARRVRPPVRASIAATTRSRCSVSASIMLGVSMALNYKTTRNSRTWLQGRKHGLKQFEVEGWKDSAIAKAEKLTAKRQLLFLTACLLFPQYRARLWCWAWRQELLWAGRSVARRNSSGPGPV